MQAPAIIEERHRKHVQKKLPQTMKNQARPTSSKIVFNKDSDDESDHGGVSANVEELIKASDDEEEEAIGIDW